MSRFGSPNQTRLHSTRWFRTFENKPEVARSDRKLFILWAAAMTISAWLYLREHWTMAVVVSAVSSSVTLASVASIPTRLAIQRCFGVVGAWLGRSVSMVLLAPVFFVVLPIVRLFSRLSGRDPLHRRPGSATLWKVSASDARKTRVIENSFAAEQTQSGNSLLALAVGLLMLVGFAEVAARVVGLGTPVLYVIDPVVGYYPAPNQRVTRFYGARIETNAFGMRAPNYSSVKPAGALRILALGDSTLWGTSSVDQEEIYARRLERLLRVKHPGREVQVFNAAANSWGPFHKLGYVEKFGTFGADIAVLCLPTRDLSRPMYGLENLPYFSTNYTPRLALEEEFRSLAWRYIGTTVGIYSEEGLRYQKAQGVKAYAELTQRLQKQGLEVMVEILPSRDVGHGGVVDAAETGLVEQLRVALVPLGVEVGYPHALFHGKGTQDEIYMDEVHLNPKGNAIYADYLEGRVASLSQKLAAWANPEDDEAP